MSTLERIGKAFDKILDLSAFLCMAFIAFIIVTLILDITLRATISQTLGPITDLDRLLLVWIPFLGSAWLLRREGHVIVDTVYTILPRPAQSLLTFFFSVVGIAIGILLVWYGGKLTLELIQRDARTLDILETPMWVYQVPIPVGGLLLAGQFARRAYASWQKWKNPQPGTKDPIPAANA